MTNPSAANKRRDLVLQVLASPIMRQPEFRDPDPSRDWVRALENLSSAEPATEFEREVADFADLLASSSAFEPMVDDDLPEMDAHPCEPADPPLESDESPIGLEFLTDDSVRMFGEPSTTTERDFRLGDYGQVVDLCRPLRSRATEVYRRNWNTKFLRVAERKRASAVFDYLLQALGGRTSTGMEIPPVKRVMVVIFDRESLWRIMNASSDVDSYNLGVERGFTQRRTFARKGALLKWDPFTPVDVYDSGSRTSWASVSAVRDVDFLVCISVDLNSSRREVKPSSSPWQRVLESLIPENRRSRDPGDTFHTWAGLLQGPGVVGALNGGLTAAFLDPEGPLASCKPPIRAEHHKFDTAGAVTFWRAAFDAADRNMRHASFTELLDIIHRNSTLDGRAQGETNNGFPLRDSRADGYRAMGIVWESSDGPRMGD